MPGVAAGVVHQGEESYGYTGVTSVENPLSVDDSTLFQFGSTGKTYTATAMMRLVERGDVDLDAPVRTYLPEFALKGGDDDVRAARHGAADCCNHTAGWEGDMMDDTGNGDDALAEVRRPDGPPGAGQPARRATVSYNNASLSVAGHVIARVTGTTYEKCDRRPAARTARAVEHVLLPERRHDPPLRRRSPPRRGDRGSTTVARPWAMPQAATPPPGGMSANARDQIAWARFHLGGDGAPLLSSREREPAAACSSRRRRCRAARSVTPGSASTGCSARWPGCRPSATAVRGPTASTPTSRCCRSYGLGVISMTNCGAQRRAAQPPAGGVGARALPRHRRARSHPRATRRGVTRRLRRLVRDSRGDHEGHRRG